MGRERLLTNPPPSVQHPSRDVMQIGCTEGKIHRLCDFPGHIFTNCECESPEGPSHSLSLTDVRLRSQEGQAPLFQATPRSTTRLAMLGTSIRKGIFKPQRRWKDPQPHKRGGSLQRGQAFACPGWH